ncbi:MAG TPA: pitrilysin family protein [Burkholderiales bacterium]
MTRYRLMQIRLAGALALGLALGAMPAAANPHEQKLSNGLKVIVKEDHRSPVVVSQIWYRAGSMDEVNGTTGVAHVLEHMMFKGTHKVPSGEFSRVIAAAGGRENAFTAQDYTAYFQQLEKSRLPVAFELESDRMQNLTLSSEEFAKEIKVVMEERRMRTDDQPHALVHEDLMSAVFQVHPYRNPIIGWMTDLESMTAQDARDWYERWYAPNNALLVVVGDVNPKEVFALAEKHYGKIRPRTLPARKPQVEPAQAGIKRLTVKAPGELPYLSMAFHAPVLRDPERDSEPYALEVLAGVLDGNASARLNQNLVRESRIAQSVDASYDSTARGPGLFYLSGTPSEGRSVAELETALRAEVAKIVKDGVSEEELNRVKAQVTAAQVYQRDSVFYQAMMIGQFEMVGLSYRDIDRVVAKIREVTAAQVQEVAKKYLVDDSLTVAVLDPQPLEAKAPRAPMKGMRHGN